MACCLVLSTVARHVSYAQSNAIAYMRVLYACACMRLVGQGDIRLDLLIGGALLAGNLAERLSVVG